MAKMVEMQGVEYNKKIDMEDLVSQTSPVQYVMS